MKKLNFNSPTNKNRKLKRAKAAGTKNLNHQDHDDDKEEGEMKILPSWTSPFSKERKTISIQERVHLQNPSLEE